MKPLILVLLLLLLPQQPTDVRVDYDKFEDRTGVMMYQVPLGRGAVGWLPSPYGTNDPDQLSLTLIHTFKGKTPAPLHGDDSVYFIISGKHELGLVTPPSLTLLIDDERIAIGTEYQSDFGSKRLDHKAVRIRVNYAVLAKIAGSKRCEGKLGITEFNFPNRLKSDIKQFIEASGGIDRT